MPNTSTPKQHDSLQTSSITYLIALSVGLEGQPRSFIKNKIKWMSPWEMLSWWLVEHRLGLIVFCSAMIFGDLQNQFENSGQYNLLTISMENFPHLQIHTQSNCYNMNELPTVTSPSFGNFMYHSVFFSQLINRITTLQQTLEIVMNQLSQMKSKNGISSVTEVSDHFQSQADKSKDKICRLPKVFPKHLKCPIEGCRRCYSSRIAMRSHLRKCHKDQPQNNWN